MREIVAGDSNSRRKIIGGILEINDNKIRFLENT